jgi:predicted lipoprotein with Yx(FWY)xxD motif
MNRKTIGLLGTLLLGCAVSAAASQTPLTSQVKNDENELLLADSFSRTLYVFDLDQGQATSACNGACAELWPPYLITAQEAAALAAPFGSIKRTSQKVQLTYQNRPLYTYAPDRKVGDDQGDGVGSVWHYVKLSQ